MKKLTSAIVGSVIILVLVSMIYLGFLGFMLVEGQSNTSPSEESDVLSSELGQLVNGEIFRTLAKDFELRYPKDWSLVKLPLSPKSGEVFIERWRLVKDPTKANSLKIDFEVSRGAEEDGELLDCEEIEINGVKYQEIITKKKEIISKIIASTLVNDKTYRITAYPSENPQDLQEIETVFSTFRILH